MAIYPNGYFLEISVESGNRNLLTKSNWAKTESGVLSVNYVNYEDIAREGGVPLAVVVCASAWSWSSWERSCSVLLMVEGAQQHMGLNQGLWLWGTAMPLTQFAIISLSLCLSPLHKVLLPPRTVINLHLLLLLFVVVVSTLYN